MTSKKRADDLAAPDTVSHRFEPRPRGSSAHQEKQRATLEVALECLERSGHLTIRADGTSMLPTIRPGAAVRVRRAGFADVSPGDIVMVRVTDGIRLHRVVEKRLGEGCLVTRGDNHRHCDPPVSAHQVLGVAE